MTQRVCTGRLGREDVESGEKNEVTERECREVCDRVQKGRFSNKRYEIGFNML